MKALGVDIIVITKNSGRTLTQCLNSIKAQTLPCRIIVVDAHSTDSTLEIAHSFGAEIYDEPSVPYKPPEGNTCAIARNEGLKHSDSLVVGFVDSDVILPPKWAESLIKYFKNPSVAAITSGCVPEENSLLSAAIRRVMSLGSTHYHSFIKPTQIVSAPTYAVLYFRGALSLVDPYKTHTKLDGSRPRVFDESLFGIEDWDLSYRLRKFGQKILGVPDSPVQHKERTSLRGFVKQVFHYAWVRARLTKKKRVISPMYALPAFAVAYTAFALWFLPPEFVLFPALLLLFSCVFLELAIKYSAKLGLLTFAVRLMFFLTWAAGYVWGMLS